MRRHLPAAMLLWIVLGPRVAIAQVPTITNVTNLPDALKQYSLARIAENAPVTLTWAAQVPLGTSYEYELSVDTDVLTSTVSPEDVRLELGSETGAGEAFGTVISGHLYSFVMRPQLLIPADRRAGGSDVRNDQPISIVLSVFPAGGRVDPNRQRSATYAWSFRYDTKPPPAPEVLEVRPGDKRLVLVWAIPSDTRDISTFEVLWNPSVTSTSAVQLDPDDPPQLEQAIGNTQDSFSITAGLANGTPAAVAVRSVDPFGNVGPIGPIHLATPVEVLDYFELYKQEGGAEDGGFCFVATAAYGSYAAPAVRPLRAFRDWVLDATPVGRGLVWAYYHLSPPLAREIAADDSLRARARAVIAPVAIGASLVLAAPLLLGLAVIGGWLGRRRRRQRCAWSLGLGLLAVGLLAFGLAAPAEAARPKATGAIGFGLEFKGGPYLPALATDASTQFPQVFGTKEPDAPVEVNARALFRLGVDLQLYRGVGTAGVGGSFGFMQFVGRGYFIGGERSQETTVFNLLPLELTLFYRFDWLADAANVPLVPYARAGLAYTVWWNTAGSGDISRWNGADAASKDDDVVGRGGKLGYTGTVGLAILLNVIEPNTALQLYESTGIRGTYLFAELTAAQVDGFGGEGFDLSDQTWSIGISVER
ncbi:MAG: hypothetical protein IT384_08075 [Deltaproteobacteria bacterium]|nr:hypothetical protein [Deltaproteobacteria bacterium]